MVTAKTVAPGSATGKPQDANAPIDPEALALARMIISIGFPEAQRSSMFNNLLDTMTGQMRGVFSAKLDNDPRAKAIVEKHLDGFIASSRGIMNAHIPAFMDAYAQGYAREFSIPELQSILDFVKTPAGTHFFSRSSAIIADPAFVSANQDYLRDLQPNIEKMQADLIAELTAYFVEHPPKPNSSS
ncbi:DUF2059 domain-containing protein [Novosphingobium cyanobacteriorum]|uniref:DUF2059 domain-containing protein n=1 Tax=Novosphingobium cyanobacteriorum TaxID=3024215 RepID=A0ABT6CCM6_9SPHN|nr:DUF2059 domain-containing protein [Novosphingobium cyanobacteriorum]MDF8331678.1 DUF2059 domain-containing protein [Novosphingobium cyanobacteriorum]